MSKVNLLPWRQELRIVKNRVFSAQISIAACVSLVVIIIYHNFLTYRIDVQTLNTNYVEEALSTVRAQITQIKGLQQNKKQLLERMDVIKSLEMDRSSTVKLLDLIPRLLPDSIYLIELNRKDLEISEVSQEKSLTEKGQDLIKNLIDEEGKQEKKQAQTKKYDILIKGIAYSNNGISFLLKKLERVKWISNVKLDQVQADTEGQVEGIGFTFVLSFTQELIEEK